MKMELGVSSSEALPCISLWPLPKNSSDTVDDSYGLVLDFFQRVGNGETVDLGVVVDVSPRFACFCFLVEREHVTVDEPRSQCMI